MHLVNPELIFPYSRGHPDGRELPQHSNKSLGLGHKSLLNCYRGYVTVRIKLLKLKVGFKLAHMNDTVHTL